MSSSITMARDMDTLYATVLVFGVLSALVYQLVLRPLFPAAAPVVGQQQRMGTTQQNLQQQMSSSQTSQQHRQRTSMLNKTQQAAVCARMPSHVAPGTRAVNSGNNLLVDGLIAFRHGTAAHQESQRDAAQQAIHRKERARVLSRLLAPPPPVAAVQQQQDGSSAASTSDAARNNGTTTSSSSSTSAAVATTVTSSTPPGKGSTVVLAIPEKDVDCAKLQKIIYLLASYYNLMLLIAVEDAASFDRAKQRGPLVQKLRGGSDNKSDATCLLDTAVLPDHRIVLSSTVAGRVAFCRQLQRIELVLDFDPDIASMLGRFGHRVVVYGNNNNNSTATSTLGAILES